jgi:hypothetical protein
MGGLIRTCIRRLEVHPTQLRNCVNAFGGRSAVRVPGLSQMKPDRVTQAGSNQAETERDIRRKAAAYFATESTWSSESWRHREIWPADWLCGRSVSRGVASMPSRGDEDLGAKVRLNFLASDRTHGARRVWHDLLAEGHPMRFASDRAIDAATGSQSPSAPASTAARFG